MFFTINAIQMGLKDAALEVDLIYSPVANFAMQQNHVTIVRKPTVKNISETELRNISVEINHDLFSKKNINWIN